jgi:hypothetical protein
MPPPESSQLPPEFRFRSDLIAGIIGLLALPISAVFSPSKLSSIPPGILLLLLIITFASAAGWLTVWRINTSGIKGSPVPPLVRAGARAGVLAALLAAAMLVLGARLFASQFAALASIPPALLSVLPGGFFGMLVAASAAGVRMPKLPTPAFEGEATSRFLPITPLLVFVSLLGFLSVLFPEHHAFLTTRAQNPLSPVSSAMSWRYQTPPQLATAEAAEWDIAGIRMLPRSAADAAFAMSPDGNWIAYVDFNKALRIIDLNSDRFSTFPLAFPPQKLSFSPDSRRVIFQTSAQPPGLGVIDLDNANTAFLPMPSGSAIPDGDLVWFSPGEVLFQTDSGPTKLLNLDTLELLDPATSRVWSHLSQADQSRWSSANRLALPTTALCSLEIRPQITWAQAPSDGSDKEWHLNETSHVCIKDLRHAYRRFCPLDAAILSAPDGSKVIRVRNSDVFAIYFKTRATPAVLLNLTMSTTPAQYPDKDRLSSALSSRSLCALVYGPVVNPLNQRVVGPNHGFVKGLVRFSSWTGTQASAWLAEEYSPVGPDDVVADLHVWQSNRAELLSEPGGKRWWAKLGPSTDGQRNLAGLPGDAETNALEHTFAYYLGTEANALLVNNIDSQPSGESTPASTPTTATSVETPQPTPEEQGRLLERNEPAYQMIAQFIAAHHLKANRADLKGLVSDYADTVSYFENGVVDRSFIFRDESLSRAKFRAMSESIVYPITIQELPGQRYKAHYQITYAGISNRDNRRINGTSDVYLLIETGPNGPKIVSQKSKL